MRMLMLQVGQDDDVVHIRAHMRLEIISTTSKAYEVLLMPTDLYIKYFEVEYMRNKRIFVNKVKIGALRYQKVVKYDIEKYSEEEKKQYKQALLYIARTACGGPEDSGYLMRANITNKTLPSEIEDKKLIQDVLKMSEKVTLHLLTRIPAVTLTIHA